MWARVAARSAERGQQRPAGPAVRGRVVSLLLGAAVVAAAQAQPAAAPAPAPLVVCMAADNPPLSMQVDGQPRGLDWRIAQTLAASLGRPLKVLPFESEYEKESTLAHEVNALLSSGLCEAVIGFPLLAGDFGPPSRPSARPPDYPGAKRKRDRSFVTLGEMAASRAYMGVALGVVLREPALPLASLADLGERRLGVVSGTLASAVAMTWRHGTLRKNLVSLGQRDDILNLLAKPQSSFDAAMLPLAMFDGWKLAHPQGALVAASWRRPIGVNLGFVTLQGAAPLRAALDQVITEALANGSLARWAAAEGVSWVAPVAPEVSIGPTIADLARD